LGSLSSHGLGVASAIEMARALGTLPRQVVVYAIEGERFGLGEDLSPRVAAAVSQLVDRVLGELAAVPAGTGEEP
jgi:hydrogenase maturation protease